MKNSQKKKLLTYIGVGTIGLIGWMCYLVMVPSAGC